MRFATFTNMSWDSLALRRRRRREQLTQQQAAELFGVTSKAWGNWERGKVPSASHKGRLEDWIADEATPPAVVTDRLVAAVEENTRALRELKEALERRK